jgi:hypothetical protein
MLTVVDDVFIAGRITIFIAGQVTGSTPWVTAAGSSARIVVTNSDLDGIVAGSSARTSKAGSQLRLEKTE